MSARVRPLTALLAMHFFVAATSPIAGCRSGDRVDTRHGRAAFRAPTLRQPVLTSSASLASDSSVATLMIEGAEARASGVAIAEAFVAVTFPIHPVSPGLIECHMLLRGWAMSSGGRVELWQISPSRRLLWSARNTSGPLFAETVVVTVIDGRDLVAANAGEPKVVNASFYIKATGTRTGETLISLETIDAGFKPSRSRPK